MVVSYRPYAAGRRSPRRGRSGGAPQYVREDLARPAFATREPMKPTVLKLLAGDQPAKVQRKFRQSTRYAVTTCRE
jgi:hypothetical protein